MSNSWSGQDGQWKGDGSEGACLTVNGDATRLSISSAQRGSPVNFYLDLASADGMDVDGYLEVTFTKYSSSSLSVGVVAPEMFKSGWKTRGMFYNGNLTNGIAALTTAFGPYPKEKDRVGVRYVRDNNTLSVIFYHNGRCLGTGFKLAPQEAKFNAYYPCLHVDGTVEISVSRPAMLPMAVGREMSTSSDVFEGEYELIKASGTNNEDIALDKVDRPVLWKVTKELDMVYRLHIKAGNTFNTKITVKDTLGLNAARIEVAPAATTLMMPPPNMRPVEGFVSTALHALELMERKQSGDIWFTGPGYKAVCKPYSRPEAVLTKYDT